jgi:uracil-DNA glycosylase family 4
MIYNKRKQLKRLYEIYDSCEVENPLYINSATRFVPGHGNPEAEIVFIGEAPGEIEEDTGIPFQGKSGKLLRKTLREYGITEENCFITNVVKFRPPENRKPTIQEIESHTALILIHELDIISPKIIVTVGGVATEAILEKSVRMTEMRGKDMIYKNRIIMPIFHPAYILRNMTVFPLFDEDIKQIRQKLRLL